MGTNQAGKGLFVIYVEIWSWRALACWVGTGLNSREGKGSREEAARRCSQKKTAGEKGTAGHKGKRNRWCAGALVRWPSLLEGGGRNFLSQISLFGAPDWSPAPKDAPLHRPVPLSSCSHPGREAAR
jgi:hypothetical protein